MCWIRVNSRQLKSLRSLAGFAQYGFFSFKISLKALNKQKDVMKSRFFPADLETLNSAGLTDEVVLFAYWNSLCSIDKDYAAFTFTFDCPVKKTAAVWVDSE